MSATPANSQLMDFNFHPSVYTHKSWLEGEDFGPVLNILCQNERYKQRASLYLLEKFGLNKRFASESDDVQMRLLLCNPTQIVRIVYLVGGILCNKAIRKAIDGNLLRQYIALMQSKEVDLANISRFAEGAGLSEVAISREEKDIEIIVLTKGLGAINVACEGIPKAFVNRLYLKLPKAWAVYKHHSVNIDMDECEKLFDFALSEVS